MPKQLTIGQLFSIPDRFHRSVQLERDFRDAAALDHYVVTPAMGDAFRRIADGLRSSSGRRAWRITGDYGVGKSSFALVLAHLLSEGSSKPLAKIADAIGWQRGRGAAALWPILLTGSREGIVPALARGVGAALYERKPRRGRMSKRLADLIKQALKVEVRGNIAELERLLDAVIAFASESGSGILLIVDELGKLLEFSAQEPDREDIFILQRLAEKATRSTKFPFLFVGLLHQGFQAYAERLPTTARHEWEKVAGRFEEIVFDQPLAHTAALVAGALNIDPRRLAVPIRDAARDSGRATAEMGWLGGGTTNASSLDVARIYPLHPTLLPVLVRFFARFGQNERSLFGFLLSTEPFGLQAFATQQAAPDTWYRLSDFYDYVRSVFGHRLSGASYRNHWLRIVETVDAVPHTSALELALLKSIAILNLLDAEDLLPTARALAAAFAPKRQKDIDTALQSLISRKCVFARGMAGGYRLWPSSSVDLEAAFQTAQRHIGPIERVAEYIRSRVDVAPIVARRHYLERGTLRYFEVRYVPAPQLLEALDKSVDADGLIVVVLADTDQERQKTLGVARDERFAARSDVLVAVSKSLGSLAPVLQDVLCWERVAGHTPELAEDKYAAAEVSRQLTEARRTLSVRLGTLAGLRSSTNRDVHWFRKGEAVALTPNSSLTMLLSTICDEVYPRAPRITNELLNRNVLSSAASAARMRLIEQLFVASDQRFLGMDPDKSPPEKSMYLSVIEKGQIHVHDGDIYKVAEPVIGNDPLNLRPALDHLVTQIEGARGERVSIAQLLESLRQPPYGIRDGVILLLFAILVRVRSHELALYENGTFLHRFGPAEFLRIIKMPAAFEVQHCQIQGVRAEVFNHLAAAFAKEVATPDPDLLDVVRALCQFAAQLPEYTRRVAGLSPHGTAVRDHLLAAREPITLIFRDLPVACGVGAFELDQVKVGAHRDRVAQFIQSLQRAIGELRDAHAELQRRIVARIAEAIEEDLASFDRKQLAARAARVSLVAREPRLRAFANRLRDPGLSDGAWAEALASFVVSKPPARWATGDEAKFGEEIGALAELFHKVEATAFSSTDQGAAREAIRLNLTRSDGHDVVRVIQQLGEADEKVAERASVLEKILPDDNAQRVKVLVYLLWQALATTSSGESSEALAPLPITSSNT